MGCDIHTAVEVRKDGKWEKVGEVFPTDEYEQQRGVMLTDEPFDWRSYGMFGFLANVRNYSRVPPISEPKGFPDDLSPELRERFGIDEDYWYHSSSWLSLRELDSFDYDKVFEDRRTTKQIRPNVWDGAALADKGEGTQTTFREFLGEGFFEHLAVMRTLGASDDVRLVFCFDN